MSSKIARISVFDFDGTLIARDSLPMFIKHSCGALRFYVGLVVLSPILVLFKFGLMNNSKAKEYLFKYFFGGMPEKQFVHYCETFVEKLNAHANPVAVDRLKQANESGHRVIILSASPRLWIEPWAKQYEVEVLGTELQIADGIITGAFASHNCYGAEKVERLQNYLNNPREEVYVTAYGDSKGDIPILSYADEGYWIKKETIVRYEI